MNLFDYVCVEVNLRFFQNLTIHKRNLFMSPPVSPTSSPRSLSGSQNQKFNSSSRKNSIIEKTFNYQQSTTEPIDTSKKEDVSHPIDSQTTIVVDDGIGLGLESARSRPVETVITPVTAQTTQQAVKNFEETKEELKVEHARAQTALNGLRATPPLSPSPTGPSTPPDLPSIIAKEPFLTRYVKNPFIKVGQFLFRKTIGGALGLGSAVAAGCALGGVYSIPGFGQVALIATAAVGIVLLLGSIYKHYKFPTVKTINKTYLKLLKSNGINIPKTKQEFSSYIKNKVCENSFLTQEQKYPLILFAYLISQYPLHEGTIEAVKSDTDKNNNGAIKKGEYKNWLINLNINDEHINKIIGNLPTAVNLKDETISFKYGKKEFVFNKSMIDKIFNGFINHPTFINLRIKEPKVMENLSHEQKMLGQEIHAFMREDILQFRRIRLDFDKNVDDTHDMNLFKNKLVDYENITTKIFVELEKLGKFSLVRKKADLESALCAIDYTPQIEMNMDNLQEKIAFFSAKKLITDQSENLMDDKYLLNTLFTAFHGRAHLGADTELKEKALFKRYEVKRLSFIRANLDTIKSLIKLQHPILKAVDNYSAEIISKKFVIGARTKPMMAVDMMLQIFKAVNVKPEDNTIINAESLNLLNAQLDLGVPNLEVETENEFMFGSTHAPS